MKNKNKTTEFKSKFHFHLKLNYLCKAIMGKCCGKCPEVDILNESPKNNENDKIYK